MERTKRGVASKQLASKQHNISKASKPQKSGATEDTLKMVLAMVNLWSDYKKKLIPGWERDLKLYNNERVKKAYEGIADTFVPMTYSTLETMSAALITADYNTDFVPEDIYKYLKDRLMPGFSGTNPDGEPESKVDYLARAIQNAVNGGPLTDDALEVLNAAYDYYWDSGDWEDKIGGMIDDGLQIGNGGLWMVFKNGKPTLIYVPFPDYVFDPTAADDESCKFGGRRYLASKKDLMSEEIVDPKTGKTTKRYDLTGLKKRSNTQDDKTEKELMEKLLYGSTLEIKNDKGVLKDDLDQCEVIEIMTEERMYTLVNRSCIAEDVENPIITQAKLRGIKDFTRLMKIPGITWANNKKGSMFIGRSETSTFWKEQERLNDNTNQKSDAVTRALLQNYRADPGLKSQKNTFSVPGGVIWAGQGQYEAIPPAQVPNAAFSEEASIKGNIRETTATDQIVKGVGSTADVTATEAKLQVAQSGQRIEKKIKKLERGPLKRIARLGMQYMRLFIADPFIVPQKANNGINPRLYNPKNYQYDFEPNVKLTVSAQSQKRQEQSQAAQAFAMILQDSSNNLVEAKKLLYPKMLDLDQDDINRIIENPNAGLPQGMPQPGAPGAVPGAIPPTLPVPAPQPIGAPA